MAQLHPFDGTCPICGDIMLVSRMSCGHCGSALEGAFTLGGRPDALPSRRSGPLGQRPDRADIEARFGRLARLDAAQLEFVEAFLRCRGIIKNVEDMLGISYPTVKARLATVLEAMGFSTEEGQPAAEHRRQRREILADLAAGRITTEEAHQQLARAQATSGDEMLE
ncbi:MAG: DUF2089 domain-containing protein [Ktedonobacterales bacterium]|nr:DUF2089 domain-containing protein [Ktedonobacterales bacterium]